LSARRRKKKGISAIGARIFGGSRRTARQFIRVVFLVFAVVGVLVLQSWQRISVVEAIEENKTLESRYKEIEDRVVCREAEVGRLTSRSSIMERAEKELELRTPEWGELVFVADSKGRGGSL